jgi:hypothetical protein
LLAPCEAEHDGIVQSRRFRNAIEIGGFVIAIEAVQMDRGDHHLAAGQPPQAFLAAFGEAGETGIAFAQRPFQQRIVTAADDRRRRHLRQACRCDQAGGNPAVEGCAGKQPAPRHLAAGHRALRHQLVKLALREPEIVGCFVRREQFGHRNQYADRCKCYGN